MRFKIITALFFSVFLFNTQAQTTKTDSVADSSVKYRAGIGYAQSYRYGDYIVKVPYHLINAGLLVEFPIKYGFGIETGLKYSYALASQQQTYAHADTAFFKYNGHFVDVPVRVTYTLPIMWGMKLFGYAGPNINIGLAQQSKVSFTPRKPDAPNQLNYPVSGTYNLYDTDLNRINVQLGAGGGLQWKNYRLRSGYDWGINNVGKNADRPQRMRGWHVSFEYEF